MILDIGRALVADLQLHLPTAIALANTEYGPDNPVVAPVTYELGVRSDLPERPFDKVPALVVGIYTRTVDWEGEQDFSRSRFPFIIQVWLAGPDEGKLYELCAKWTDVLDYYVQEWGSKLIAGYTAPEAPVLDISTPASRLDGNYIELVQAGGVFKRAQ